MKKLSQGPTALLKVLAGILEDAVQTLQRIEIKVEEQNNTFNLLTKKLNELENKVETGLKVIADQGIQTLEHNLTTKIDELELGDLDQMTYKLDTLMSKLQKGIHILSVQGIISRIEKLVTVPTGGVAPRKKKQAAAPQQEAAQQQAGGKKTSNKAAPQESQAPPPAEEEDDGQPHLLKPSSFFG